MDGTRVQEYFANESKALLDIYRQFQILLPNRNQNSASHNGEDGRYVESLIKEFLKRFLPKDLEVLTGSILRPGVKTGINNRSRSGQSDMHSTQMDIIVYDSGHYPIFQRFGDNAIVPPEGVISIVSVKKQFHDGDFLNEAIALKHAAKLCKNTNENKKKMRGPYLALMGMHSIEKKHPSTEKWIFNKLIEAYDESRDTFDETIGLITNIEGWSIFKCRPRNDSNCDKAEYIFFDHVNEEHFSLQFLLTGILSVYYDDTRNFRERPGFTGFPSGRKEDAYLGSIKVCGLR